MTDSSFEVEYAAVQYETPRSQESEDEVFTAAQLSELVQKRRESDTDSEDNSMEQMDIYKLDPTTGTWSCRPYKRDILHDEIQNANAQGRTRREATLETLTNMGVQIHIIPANSEHILKEMTNVVQQVAQKNRLWADAFNPRMHQRCLLYEDSEGRLFNLVLPSHAVGPSTEYINFLESFCGAQAMVAFVVLCRSFPCAFQNDIGNLQPAYLSLVLGLVLSEEISHSWINTAIMVRAIPSISAYTLTTTMRSDWIRKMTMLILASAGAASGRSQKYMTILGVSMACSLLLANLGSRAWLFLQWKPLSYNGPFAALIAYVLAMAVGLIMPYMGHREIEAGGKRALESVLFASFIVAAFFCLSDIDEVQKFIVIGSDACPQDQVNMLIGTWWTVTLLTSLLLVMNISPYRSDWQRKEEAILVPDHASPVGYKVPNLPDFFVDPNLVQLDHVPLSMQCELMFGLLFAVVIGGGMVYFSFTDWGAFLTNR